MGVFMAGINRPERLSRVVVFVFFVLFCFGGFHFARFARRSSSNRTDSGELITTTLHFPVTITAQFGLFLCTRSQPRPLLTHLLSPNYVFWSIWSLSQMQASFICMCSNFGAGRVITAAMPLDTQTLQQASTNKSLLLMVVFVYMCKVRFDLWAFL